MQKQTKPVSSGSSPFRCFQQQGIEGTRSIFSTEQFFLRIAGSDLSGPPRQNKLILEDQVVVFEKGLNL
jgi:hypothetical protein